MYLDGQGTLFQQVYRVLRDGIVDGRFAATTRLPPTRALASDLGVSRATVLLAYEQLAAEGYVGARQGSGTYVQGPVSVAPAVPRRPPAPRGEPRLGRLASALLAQRRPPLESAYAGARPALRWDFRYGLPSLDDFPLETWQRCIGRAARSAPAGAYDYGPPQGSPALRAALAAYLGRSRGVSCAPEQIVVVTGSQQGIDLAARLLVRPGARAVVEEPGFEGARNAFLAAGATLAPLAVDDEGLDPDALQRDACLALVTPSHQYPLGGVLSWTRRAALLAWASRADAWVIEDDYDGEYRFDGRPVPPLKTLDADDRVLYLGTFSKVMFSALRVGYLVYPNAAPVTEYVEMAEGSSSAAPVIRPGPRSAKKLRRRAGSTAAAECNPRVLSLMPFLRRVPGERPWGFEGKCHMVVSSWGCTDEPLGWHAARRRVRLAEGSSRRATVVA
jgi:GntR family transcriptional regulator / MocR family aminotransferase